MPTPVTYKVEGEESSPPPITPLAAPVLFFDINNDRAVSYLGDRVDLFSNDIMKTRSAALRRALQAGVSAGEGINELSTRVMEVYEGLLHKRWEAERIARTETIASLNAGTFDGYTQSGVPMDKFWVSTRDTRVRGMKPTDQFNHLSPDGQKRSLDEPFRVSGELLMFPGDYSRGASGGNLINCRCTVKMKVRKFNGRQSDV